MFHKNDISHRSIVLVNTIEQKIKLHVKNGNIFIVDKETEEVLKQLIKQKVFALFLVGNISLTSAVMKKCAEFAISICLMHSNFKSYAFIGEHAEGNYLLRKKQFQISPNFDIAKLIIQNKIINQMKLLKSIRKKTENQQNAILKIQKLIDDTASIEQLDQLMGIEGNAAKIYFKNYFEPIGWQCRKPRTKIDPINTVMDIGYTFLFNFVESFVRLFGFDLYIGNLHQLWFERKSLICDLMEPFRPIIDHQIKKSFQLKQFSENDFQLIQNQYLLQHDKIKFYCHILVESLVENKLNIFSYVQDYYKAFMGQKSMPKYPQFLI